MENSYLFDLIYHGSEERNIEYKSSMPWEACKDKVLVACLAFANTKDGGSLIFGVDDEKMNCIPSGMEIVHFKSFNQDLVQDYINKFADPYVDLKVSHVDLDNKLFVVIQVNEFDELPIICKKDGAKVQNGDIYIRPKRKNESVRVSCQSEMREILDMALLKSIEIKMAMCRNFLPQDITMIDTDQASYAAQLGDL